MKLPKSLPCGSTESLLQAVFQHRPSESFRHHGVRGDNMGWEPDDMGRGNFTAVRLDLVFLFLETEYF